MEREISLRGRLGEDNSLNAQHFGTGLFAKCDTCSILNAGNGYGWDCGAGIPVGGGSDYWVPKAVHNGLVTFGISGTPIAGFATGANLGGFPRDSYIVGIHTKNTEYNHSRALLYFGADGIGGWSMIAGVLFGGTNGENQEHRIEITKSFIGAITRPASGILHEQFQLLPHH